jgi:hypothetical protein
MTKLRRKIKDMAKKRAHKNTVQKRKLERALKGQEAKKLAAAENAQQGKEEDIVDDEADVPEVSERKAANMLGGLVTSKIGGGPNGKKKQLTRKQLKRKAKVVERGEAISGALDKKWAIKKLRVKQRAQVRNENVGQ